jgi:hypothetical protein
MLTFFFSSNVFALNNVPHIIVEIPKLDNAQVFADFTDGFPAVLNYFTQSTEAQIIEFYKKHYGKVVSKERKRGRLTLFFLQENQSMRVVISQQNNKHQIDIMVDRVRE